MTTEQHQHCTYLWNINHIALDNLQQSMLDTFTRHITTDTNVATGFTNLIRLVNVHNTPLTSIQVLSTLEIEL